MPEDKRPADDNWAALLGDLGIESNPQPREQPQAKAGPEPQSIIPDEDYEPVRPASGWDDLLDDFGIDSPADAAAKSGDAGAGDAEAHDADADDARAEGADARHIDSGESIAALPAVPPVEQPSATTDAQREPSTPQVDSAVPEHDIRAEGEDTEVEAPYPEKAEAKSAAAEPESPAEDGPDIAAPEMPEAAFSGMSKLSLPDWFPFAGRKTKAPPPPPPAPAATREPAPPAEPEQQANGAELAAVDGSVIDLPASSEHTEDASGDAAPEDGLEDKPPKRRRRRRGRRRGRGAKSEGDSLNESAESGDEPPTPLGEPNAEVLDTDAEELAAEEATDRDPAVDAIDADTTDSDEDSQPADKSAAASEGRRRTGGGRQIPSWQETIGVVVDA
ncbi:MAG: hypothetical protein AAF790_11040, partial [Planctomycetota bacterium]